MEFVANLRIATSFEGKDCVLSSMVQWNRGERKRERKSMRETEEERKGKISLVDDERREKRGYTRYPRDDE